MPEKHLFSKQLCSCIKIRATQTHSETIYRPKWFLEHLFLLEHYYLLSLRVSDVLVHFQPYAPSPMKMHSVLLLLGCLLKTLLEKMQLLAVLCIAKWIQLSAAQCPHKVTAIEGNSYMKETQVWLEELDVLTTSTHTLTNWIVCSSFLNPAAFLVCCAFPVSLALRLFHESPSDRSQASSNPCSTLSVASICFTFSPQRHQHIIISLPMKWTLCSFIYFHSLQKYYVIKITSSSSNHLPK